MCNYMCNFIKTGNPNDDGVKSAGLSASAGVNYQPTKAEYIERQKAEKETMPEWKPFSSKEPNVMIFEKECKPKVYKPGIEISKYL